MNIMFIDSKKTANAESETKVAKSEPTKSTSRSANNIASFMTSSDRLYSIHHDFMALIIVRATFALNMISSSMCSLIIDGIVGTTNVMEPLWSRQVNRSSIMLGRLDVMPGLTSLTHLATGRISETLAVHVATCIICQVRSPILG